MIPAASDIVKNLATLKINVEKILKECGKSQKITILAVSKTKPIEDILEAYHAGQKDFGENYVHELEEKHDKLPSDISWHFIGHLQSNKVNQVIVPNLSYIHTVDSEKYSTSFISSFQHNRMKFYLRLASKINKKCELIKKTNLKVLVQVKTSEEPTKSGVSNEEAILIAKFIKNNCKNIIFSGLMTIGLGGDIESFK